MTGEKPDIASIRQEYRLAVLDEATAGDNPIAFFQRWFEEASSAMITEINAMALSTADESGRPHSRVVLLKGLELDGFVFFTNYDSAKGKEVAANPHVSLLFFWKELERQVRIEGSIEKIPEADSDAYFKSRPRGSRIGAWASPQSSPIADRNFLDVNYSRYEHEFSDMDMPRPSHWGGYVVRPQRIEFWQGRESRMHDRILFVKAESGRWDRSRLAP